LAIVDADSDRAWQERIARYVSVSNGADDAERHLLFVSTSRGYHLVERDGPPPAALHDVTVPEHEGLFRVVKVAPSPFPNDSRACAYLQQTR
jgi:hypothetical protein